MDKVERASLLGAYQRYLAAFNANDLDAINDCISYPLALVQRIGTQCRLLIQAQNQRSNTHYNYLHHDKDFLSVVCDG